MATFKLSASQKKERASALADLETATNLYKEACETFAARMVQIGAELREVYDGRSERWQESDAGSAAASFVEAYESFDESTMSEPEEPADVLENNGLTEESEDA